MTLRQTRNQMAFDAHINGMEEALAISSKEYEEVKLLLRQLEAGRTQSHRQLQRSGAVCYACCKAPVCLLVCFLTAHKLKLRWSVAPVHKQLPTGLRRQKPPVRSSIGARSGSTHEANMLPRCEETCRRTKRLP